MLRGKGNVTIGSFASADIDKVITEKNLPRESAETLARMEGGEIDDRRSEVSV